MNDPDEISPVEAWLRVHRQLVDAELAFTDTALKAVRGEIDMSEVDAARVQLMALRELCSTIYAKAFPSPAPPPDGR